VLEELKVAEVMRFVRPSMLAVVEGGLCLLNVLEVMRCVCHSECWRF